MTEATPPKGQRVAKLMARAGLCSRREAERWIAELRVEHLVVVRSEATTTGRPERQRRLCMERML
ncbi:MAG: hypothetical protein JKY92_03960, partial [Magnetovibrio sp.]|nr:hypothetical protein [Magnetovibrio sp.]